MSHDVDVLIVGAGLAGSTLARQLLLETDKSVLQVDRRPVPPERQKVGEATVQLSGFYLSKVLDLQEHLLREHFLKYNLRFYWPVAGGSGRYEDWSQSYIRSVSNIATYQLDRNKLEDEILRLNAENPRYAFHAPATGLEVDLRPEGGPHPFRFRTAGGEEISGSAGWIVDASGRGRFLARRLGLSRPGAIRHGTSFFWVEGLVDPEKVTDVPPSRIRNRPDRSALGHMPVFLATNHFCGPGWWLWLIPLHGCTSVGLVYEHGAVSRKEVANAEGLLAWITREMPRLGADLAQRRVICHSGLVDYGLDCGQTLSASGWAMTGEAGRFSDPLYSPGGDLISIYNTLITDAIRTADRQALESKVRYYESLERAVYEAYVPGYNEGYILLGDQEAFSLRYTWELTIYFAFYVFPFVNDLFTDTTFLPGFLRRFGKLGPWNRNLMRFLVGYYHWKKEKDPQGAERETEPVFFDFTEIGALREAERCFYKVGVGSEEARKVLDVQLRNLEALVRFCAAHIGSVVVGDPDAVHNAAFVNGFDPDALRFDEAEIRALWERCAGTPERYEWPYDVPCMKRFRHEPDALPVPVESPAAAMGAMA
jgi:flavin-dependent dehydrogenase